LLTALVSWAPLAVFAAAQGLGVSARPRESFLLDVSAYARYLIASPVFVLAASVYVRKLDTSAQELLRAVLVADRDRRRFVALLQSTRAVLVSRWTEALLIVFAYAGTLTLSPMVFRTGMTTWIAQPWRPWPHLSAAGWWCTLVSQPIFMGLIGLFLCRVLLWARLLFHVARMDLQLVASHPDRLGGLRFMFGPVRGFSVLAFAIGAVGAGGIAEDMIFYGRSLVDYRYAIAVQVMSTIVLFAGPFLMLIKPLIELEARGTLFYGRLATDLGHEFEARWGRLRAIDGDALHVQDFSATNALFSVAAGVREINPFVLDVKVIATVAIATLLPYVPLFFLAMPLDDVMRLAMRALT
jgi:hypothetical protein